MKKERPPKALAKLAKYKVGPPAVSRHQLARRLDCAVETMKRIEDGESIPDVRQALKLRELAQIKIEDWIVEL